MCARSGRSHPDSIHSDLYAPDVSDLSRSRLIDLGNSLPYSEGVEDQILRVLKSSEDVSARSDELAARIVDWNTRYHFSRLRANLLKPFRIGPSIRVLEIGCGTGVNLRLIGESGAEVVGVEGSRLRAECAAERCRDLPNVTVYAGDASSLPELGHFDIVLLIGVLEYAAADSGGGRGPDALLALARRHLAPDGCVAVAIENQLGMKYLLGYREDHHGLPWVGLDDYRNALGPRTWSRAELGQLLMTSGFEQTRWFYPFPDYKLPTFISSHELLASAEGQRLTSQLVANPVVDHSAQPALAADPKRFFDLVVRSGLGPDLANSFLVIAGEDPSRWVDDDAAWMFSNERQRCFLIERVVSTTSGSTMLIQVAGPTSERPATAGRVTNIGHHRAEMLTERSWSDAFRAAWVDGDTQEVVEIWKRYSEFLTGCFGSSAPRMVDGQAIDCTLSNLVSDKPAFVDREWVWSEPLPIEVVLCRALFDVSWSIIRAGDAGSVGDVRSLMTEIGRVIGLAVDDLLLRDFCELEAEFQSSVTGVRSDAAAIEGVLGLRMADLVDPVIVSSLTAHTRRLEQHTAGLEQHVGGLEKHVRGLEEHVTNLEAAQAHDAEMIDNLREQLVAQGDATESARIEAESLRASRSFRLGNRLIRMVTIFRRA